MRWITAGCALALVLAGGFVLWSVFDHMRTPIGQRTDELDITILIGGVCVLAGLFVLTVLAVTT